MAKMYYDDAANLAVIRGKKVAIIGYGSQGHAHALNLHESGVKVMVGLRKGGASWDKAKKASLKVAEIGEAVKGADVVMMLMPDEHIAAVYRSDVEPNLKKGGALAFAHGFNIHYGQVQPRKDMACTYDAASQTLQSYTYDAFGAPPAKDKPSGTYDLRDNPFRYSGEYRDPIWGGYYLRARWYDPDLPIFLSRDPAEQDRVSLFARSVAGEVTRLDDPRFAPEIGVEGMWQYYDFLLEGRPGIYFLEPYDPTKIPVLFVHGTEDSLVPAAALDPLRAAARDWTARRASFRLLPPSA